MNRFTRSLLLAWTAALTACSPLYVARAGIEEARILSRRRPIVRVIEDPATPAETRRKLDLVLQARAFAEHAAGLNVGQSYTTYSWVDSDTLLLVVSGSRQDRFQAYTWWFPIVGRVPYKGFFDFAAAHRETARLEAAGYDSYVRPAGAFSTLGWFNDPLLNTLLRYDDVSLVSTVIHELLHNTVFIPGQVAFNESFANFVGDRGAIEFFCLREGEHADRCTAARDAWTDNLLYGSFLSGLVANSRPSTPATTSTSRPSSSSAKPCSTAPAAASPKRSNPNSARTGSATSHDARSTTQPSSASASTTTGSPSSRPSTNSPARTTRQPSTPSLKPPAPTRQTRMARPPPCSA
jgi:predicted aminopeptidase